MTEPFLALSPEERAEALRVAADASGRPADLLEKDVWVVWTLDALFNASFGPNLCFKGGTSLSKVFGAIQRFSEDLDITYDIRAFAPDLVAGSTDSLPLTMSQGKRWSEQIAARLTEWVRDEALPEISHVIEQTGAGATARADGEKLFIRYDRVIDGATEYVKPEIMIEFGARATGEPAHRHTVACDAAPHLSMLSFPTAEVRVLDAERTFWEKATAIHVFCLQGRLRGERYARHWYDLVRLDDAGIAERALADRGLAEAVALHKHWFFSAKDVHGEKISYDGAVHGALRLVPTGPALASLEDDYARMVDAGLLEEDPPSFGILMQRCGDLERRANQASPT
jgi:predicted nucleotidyltransferase component of viral defense system